MDDMQVAILVAWGIIGFFIGGSILANLNQVSNKQAIFVGVLSGPVGWISITVYAIAKVFKIIWKMLA
jgi:hypothetical protein